MAANTASILVHWPARLLRVRGLTLHCNGHDRLFGLSLPSHICNRINDQSTGWPAFDRAFAQTYSTTSGSFLKLVRSVDLSFPM
jgi:hypothetical protein